MFDLFPLDPMKAICVHHRICALPELNCNDNYSHRHRPHWLTARCRLRFSIVCGTLSGVGRKHLDLWMSHEPQIVCHPLRHKQTEQSMADDSKWKRSDTGTSISRESAGLTTKPCALVHRRRRLPSPLSISKWRTSHVASEVDAVQALVTHLKYSSCSKLLQNNSDFHCKNTKS